MTVIDLEQLKAQAKEAKNLLEDQIFNQAIRALRQQWHAEQMATTEEGEIVRLARQMQVLEAIPQQLQIFINDYKMAAQRKG
jgi:hypothetical protein